MGYYHASIDVDSQNLTITLRTTPTLIQPLEDLSPDPQLDTIIESLFENNAIIVEQSIGECGSQLPIVPKFVGVNAYGVPSLLNDIRDTSKQALEDGLVTFLTDGVNEAESLGKALRNLALDFLKTMQKM